MGRLWAVIVIALSLLQFSAISAQAAAGGRYFALTPARILDTRSGVGAPAGRLAAQGTLNLTVGGQGGVPVGAAAVVLNVTVTDVGGGGFLTVWPAGRAQPLASNLNFRAGQTVANLVEIGLGAGGQISIFSSSLVSVIADVAGWVNADPTGPDGRFNPVVPARLLDTRSGFGGATTLGPGMTISVKAVGLGGVPAQGVSAAVLNLTATGPTAAGYVTAWPHGLPRPLASNLNFLPGQTVANRAVVAVGQGGFVDVFNAAGSVDLVVDISGWFSDTTGVTGSVFFELTPSRILDTRSGAAALGPGQFRTVLVAGRGGVPAMGGPDSPSAVVANITVTNTSGAGYLTVWPDASSRPLASDLNWAPGQTTPNLVVVALGSSGAIDIYNSAGITDVIVDVVGYYVGSALAPVSPPSRMFDLINQDRLANGVPPLAWSPCLADVALGESARQAAAGAISHANGVYLNLACGFTRSAENVGYSSIGIADDSLNTAFMQSPGHRANILNPAYTMVGTAWVVAPNGFGYISEEFGG